MMKPVVRCTECGVSFDPGDDAGIKVHELLERRIGALRDRLDQLNYEDEEHQALSPEIMELLDERMALIDRVGKEWHETLHQNIHVEAMRVLKAWTELAPKPEQKTD